MLLFASLRKLNDYKPKNHGMTSMSEIWHIHDTLGIKDASDDDLCNLRDMCVLMWSERYDDLREKGDADKADEVWDAMQSITAVIDHFKYKRGMAV